MTQIMDRETLNAGGELPDGYGEDTLVLLPRDPQWIHAYWEISPGTIERIKQHWYKQKWDEDTFNHARQVLMLYRHRWNREGEIEDTREIELGPGARNWYMEVEEPDHYYHVELGWNFNGHFYPLMASNTVLTPRNRISDLVDENWTLPEWKFRRLFRRISLFQVSSPEMVRRRSFR